MLWFKAARYPLRSENLQVLIRVANGLIWPALAYALICSIGFLAVVGVSAKSLLMAALPWVAPILAACIGLGYLWEHISHLMGESRENTGNELRRHGTPVREPVDLAHKITLGWQGLQLVLYLAFVGIAMGTIAVNLPYSAAILSVLVVFGGPLALVPVVHAHQERSLIAIVWALPHMGRLLNRRYGVFCTQLWLYTIVMIGIIYPLMMTLLVISVAGIAFILGFILSCGVGFTRLLVTLTTWAQTPISQPFEGSSLVPDARPYGFAPQAVTADSSSGETGYRPRRIQLRPTKTADGSGANGDRFNGSWPYRP